jgi:hypothetical protein
VRWLQKLTSEWEVLFQDADATSEVARRISTRREPDWAPLYQASEPLQQIASLLEVTRSPSQSSIRRRELATTVQVRCVKREDHPLDPWIDLTAAMHC